MPFYFEIRVQIGQPGHPVSVSGIRNNFGDVLPLELKKSAEYPGTAKPFVWI
jgi:hypothetical protein